MVRNRHSLVVITRGGSVAIGKVMLVIGGSWIRKGANILEGHLNGLLCGKKRARKRRMKKAGGMGDGAKGAGS